MLRFVVTDGVGSSVKRVSPRVHPSLARARGSGHGARGSGVISPPYRARHGAPRHMRFEPVPTPRGEGASPPATLTLPALAESVPAARRFVMNTLADLDAAGACNDVVALVSELATNAVIHARTPYTIVVSRERDTVRVRVHDLSAVIPRRRAYGLDATTGRGLRLVASMSADWGIEAESGGKAVWFEVRCNEERTPPEWYADLDVDALLSAFSEGDLGGASLPGSVMTE